MSNRCLTINKPIKSDNTFKRKTSIQSSIHEEAKLFKITLCHSNIAIKVTIPKQSYQFKANT